MRYFVVDRDGRLQRAVQATVQEVWNGKKPPSAIGFDPGDEIRLVSCVINEELKFQRAYLLRLSITRDGTIDPTERMQLLRVVRDVNLERPEIRHQVTGWPENLASELAQALDVPALEFERFGVGGPLLTAEYMGMSVSNCLIRYRDAFMTNDG